MTRDQRRFIALLCDKYHIDPVAWENEDDALNVALLMIDLLFANVRAHQSQIKVLQDLVVPPIKHTNHAIDQRSEGNR